MLTAAVVAGFPLAREASAQEADQLYNVPKTGNVPHLVGEHLLKCAGLKAGSAQAHAHTYLDFERAALQYGKVGGFAHLSTLVMQLRSRRPDALPLDGGDTWRKISLQD